MATTGTKKTVSRSAKAEARTESTDAAPRTQTTAKRSEGAAAAKRRDKGAPSMHVVANDNSQGSATAATSGVARGRLPTGSLHTEARKPAQADTLKKRLTALMSIQQRLAELKRSAQKNFFEVGEILHRVREERLFEVKGYGSFEAFVDREVNLGQQFCATTVRIYETFRPEAVREHGFAKLARAVGALNDEQSTVTPLPAAAKSTRPAIPPHKL